MRRRPLQRATGPSGPRRVPRLAPVLLAFALVLAPIQRVFAQAADPRAADGPPRTYASMQIGPALSSERLTLCVEVAPAPRVGVEACGTGAGFLHHDPEPEIAHFRANWRIISLRSALGWVEPGLSFGFAELQVGEDGSGFDFSGSGDTGVETAGPEAGASLRSLTPVYGGFELISELRLGLAYFPHAGELVRPQATAQPSGSFTLGFGF